MDLLCVIALLFFVFTVSATDTLDSAGARLTLQDGEISFVSDMYYTSLRRLEDTSVAIELRNDHDSGIAFTANINSDESDMFEIYPADGYVEAGEYVELAVHVSTLNVGAGSYICTVEVIPDDGGIDPVSTTVNATVSGGASLFQSSTDTLVSTMSPGESAEVSLTLVNAGSFEMTWEVTVTNDQFSSFSVSPTSGVLAAGNSTVVVVSMSVSAAASAGTVHEGLLTFLTTEDDLSVVAVSTHVTIVPGETEPSECVLLDHADETTLSNPLSHSAGQVTTVLVQSKDAAGNNHTTSPSGEFVVSDSGVTDFVVINLGDGTTIFDVTYTAAGSYFVDVSYGGVGISGSPVEVVVSSATVDAGNCLVLADLTECLPNTICAETTAGISTEFSVSLFDKYGNAIVLDGRGDSVVLSYVASVDLSSVTMDGIDSSVTISDEITASTGELTFALGESVAGSYTVEVLINEQEVSSSGFLFTITPDASPISSESFFVGDLVETTTFEAGSSVDVEMTLKDTSGNIVTPDDVLTRLSIDEAGFSAADIVYNAATFRYSSTATFTTAGDTAINVLFNDVSLLSIIVSVVPSVADASTTTVAPLRAGTIVADCVSGEICVSDVVVGDATTGTSFVVSPRDVYGNLVETAVPKACLYQVDNGDPTFCTTEDDGTYTFTASSTNAATSAISVQLADEDVMNSGFLVGFILAEDAVPDAAHSFAELNGVICEIGDFCLSAVAGDTASLKVYLFDEFDNFLGDTTDATITVLYGDTSLVLDSGATTGEWVISAAEEVQVRVAVNGVELSNSWFNVTATAGNADSTTSYVDCPNSFDVSGFTVCDSISAVEVATFHLYLLDSYNNPVSPFDTCTLTVDGVTEPSTFVFDLDQRTYTTCGVQLVGQSPEAVWVSEISVWVTTPSETNPHEFVVTSGGVDVTFWVWVDPGEASDASVVTSIPTEILAGETFSVTIQSQDRLGNILTNSASSRFAIDFQTASGRSVQKVSTHSSSGPTEETAEIMLSLAGTYDVIVTYEGNVIENGESTLTVTHTSIFSADQSLLLGQITDRTAGETPGLDAEIYPKDEFGNDIDVAVTSGRFAVSVESQDGTVLTGSVNTADVPYVVSFLATVAGLNEVTVTFDGDPVGVGSFGLVISPAAADPASSSVFWGGTECSLLGGVACALVNPGGTLSFHIEVRDVYGNAVEGGTATGWVCNAGTTPLLSESLTCAENAADGVFDLLVPTTTSDEVQDYTLSVTLGDPPGTVPVTGSGLTFTLSEATETVLVSVDDTYIEFVGDGTVAVPCSEGLPCGDEVFAGHTTAFEMQQRSTDGTPVTTPSGMRCLMMLSTDGGTTMTEYKDCVDGTDGVYVLPATTSVPGTYTMYVKLNTNFVSNAGFQVIFVAGQASVDHSLVVSLDALRTTADYLTICSDGLICGSTVIAGESQPFAIIIRDVYNNTIPRATDLVSASFTAVDGTNTELVSYNELPSVPRFEAGVIAETAGDAEITVSVNVGNGEENLMSFFMEVSAASVSSVTSYVDQCGGPGGDCVVTVVAGIEEIFLFHSRDVFNNHVPDEFSVEVDGSSMEATLRSDGISEFTLSLSSDGAHVVSIFDTTATLVFSFSVRVGNGVPVESLTEFFPVGGNNPVACTTDGTCTTVTAGDTVSFSVVVKDVYENVLPLPTVSYSISPVSSSYILLSSVVEAGSSEFSFSLTQSGDYSLSVYAEGVEASGSPTIVSVTSRGVIETSEIRLREEESNVVSAGDTLSFSVVLRDVYGNPVEGAATVEGSEDVSLSVSQLIAFPSATDAQDAAALTLGSTSFVEASNTASNLDPSIATEVSSAFAGARRLQAFSDGQETMPGVPFRMAPFGRARRPLQVPFTVDVGPSASDSSSYTVSFATDEAGLYELVLTYAQSTQVAAWEVLVSAGDPDPDSCYVVTGEEQDVCIASELCGCDTVVNTPIYYTLLLFDAFNNAVTGKSDIECTFEATSLGVLPLTGSSMSTTEGTCAVHVEAFFPADYEVSVSVDGDEVSNSPFRAIFDASDDSDINATMSNVGFSAEGYTSYSGTVDDDWEFCENGLMCGPTEVLAGETVTFVVHSRNSEGNVTTKVGGTITQYLLSVADYYTLETGVANPDGTYRIDVLVEEAVGNATLKVHLNADLVGNVAYDDNNEAVLFRMMIIPAAADAGMTEVFSGSDPESTQTPCRADTLCGNNEGIVVGVVKDYIVITADRFGNKRTNNGSEVVFADMVTADGATTVALTISNNLDGTYGISVLTHTSSTFTVTILLSDEPIAGSSFKTKFEPGPASPENSAIDYCSDATTCAQCEESNCPTSTLVVGRSVLYSLVVRDMYNNRKEDASDLVDQFSYAVIRPGGTDVTGTPDLDGSDMLIEIESGDTTVAGSYTLHVYYTGGNEIEANWSELANTPVNITFLPGTASTTHSKVSPADGGDDCEDGLPCPGTSVSAGSRASYDVSLFDGYGNSRYCNNTQNSDCWTDTGISITYAVTGPAPKGGTISREAVGLWTFAETFTVSGQYSFSVRLNGVGFSSFVLQVDPAEYLPSSSYLTRDGQTCASNAACGSDSNLCCLTAGDSTEYAILLQDVYENSVVGQEVSCIGWVLAVDDTSTFTFDTSLATELACAQEEEEGIPSFSVSQTTAGYYLISATIDGAALGNVPVLLTVDPGSISSTHTYVEASDGTKCIESSIDAICGGAHVPSATVAARYFVVPHDVYGNRITDLSGIAVVRGGFASDDVSVLSASTDDTTKFVLSLLQTESGVHEVAVTVSNVPVVNSGFYVQFKTPQPQLSMSVALSLTADSSQLADDVYMNSVAEEFKILLAEELGVDPEDIVITGYTVVSGATDRRRLLQSSVVSFSYSYSSNSASELTDLEVALASLNVSSITASSSTFTATEDSSLTGSVETDATAGPSATESKLFFIDSATGEVDSSECDMGESCPSQSITFNVGESFSYLLQTHDSNGNMLDVDFGYTATAEIRDSSSSKSNAMCTNNRDGTYTCTLTPQFLLDTDEYAVRVRLNDGQTSNKVGGDDVYVQLVSGVTPSTTSTVHLSLTGDTLPSQVTTTADDDLELYFVARDTWGNVIDPCPGDSFKVTHRSSNSTTASTHVVSSDTVDSSRCTVSVTTRNVGVYVVNAFVEGLPLEPTDVQHTVIAGKFNAANCTATGTGLSEVEADTEVRFIITSRDSFGNAQGDATFSISFKSESGESLPITPSDTGYSGSEFQHEYQYTTSVSHVGDLSLYITDTTGNHIQGSPFSVRAMCPSGYVHQPDSSTTGESCTACDGTFIVCTERNITMDNLESKAGFWRRAVDTYDFDECLNNDIFKYGDVDACSGFTTDCEPCIGVMGWNDTVGPDFQCARGYESRLCSVCSLGYTRTGTFECQECPDDFLNLLWISGIFFVALIVIGALVKNQIDSAEQDRYHTIALKIFMSYIQIVSFARYIEFDWPDAVVEFFEREAAIVSPSSSVLSLDCQLDDAENVVFFEKVKFYIMIPPVILFIFVVFFGCQYLWMKKFRFSYADWKARLKGLQPGELKKQHVENRERALEKFSNCEKTMEDLSAAEVSHVLGPKEVVAGHVRIGMIVFLFMAYPTLTTEIFLLFSCKQLSDGKSYVYQSLDVECWGDTHVQMIVPWGVVGIVGYVIGVPTLAFGILYWYRDNLHHPKVLFAEKYRNAQQKNEYYLRTGRPEKMQHVGRADLKIETNKDRMRRYICRMRYGFLYFGYRPQYYWWESWIMLRKTLVVFITVFMSTMAVTIQGLTLLGLTIFALILHLHARPYDRVELMGVKTDLLNRMEMIGISASMFTILVGMYFSDSTGIENTETRAFLTSVVFFLNVGTLGVFTRNLYLIFRESEGFMGELLRTMDRFLPAWLRRAAMKGVKRASLTVENVQRRVSFLGEEEVASRTAEFAASHDRDFVHNRAGGADANAATAGPATIHTTTPASTTAAATAGGDSGVAGTSASATGAGVGGPEGSASGVV
eukprot:Rmarinus@m.12261